MEPICDATFVAQMKRLPVDWQQPQGNPEAAQFQQAFQTAHHMTVPQPGCYFWAQSTLKRHTDSCKDMGTIFKDFCHSMLKGFKQSVDMWRVQAKFQNLMINGPVAVGPPGCLSGPDLASNIKNFSLPAASGEEKKWRDAVASGLAQCWSTWQQGVSIPGLPFYPAFTAFPSPYAPPMPNVPFPLIACPSAGQAQMTPAMLKNAMVSAYGGPDNDGQFAAMAFSIGTAVSTSFMAWLPMQQIMNVLGKGSIPTFAPPVAPVGPVVMGDNIAVPGHLAT